MTDQENTPPAVWDPTARGGAGGWVRRKAEPGAPAAGGPAGFPGAQGFATGAQGFDDNQPTTMLPPVPGGPPDGSPFRSPAPPGFPPGPPQPFTPQPFPPQPAAFPGAGPGQPPFPAFDQPQHPSYPSVGDYPEPEEAAPRRGRTPMFIALGGVLLVVIGVGVTWAVRNSGTGSDAAGSPPGATQQPPPAAGTGTAAPAGSAPAAASPSASPGAGGAGPNAAAQAKALDALLGQAETARAGIGSSVAKVRSCPATPDIDSAVAVFDSGAKQRDQLIAALARLDLGDLPGGADLAKTLNTAWQQSGDIDRAYAAWGRTVSSQGCVNGTAPGTADYKRAGDLNPQATQSKNEFAGKWKPIAEAYGLTPRTADRI
ncbi:hypothetical protein AB0K43_17345 [Kitasatospora sp. NPDC049258]|uniref:hypothetical protein n=1 Tax=Kitasatospora sp. NPDC049258 TaxID=3155394 RepID=UPI00341CF164